MEKGEGGENIPSVPILPKNSILLLLSLRRTSKKDFLIGYLGCVKAEKNDEPGFE